MAKFIFRLEGILNLKGKIEEQKKLEYGKAVQELEKLKRELEASYREKQSNIAEFRNKIHSGIEPGALLNYYNFLDFLKMKIETQKKLVAKASAFAEEKRLELLEAVKDRKILDSLRERNFEEFLIEEKRLEHVLVDEVVSYRYNVKE